MVGMRRPGVWPGVLISLFAALGASGAQAQIVEPLAPGEQTADFVAQALARVGLFQREGAIGVLERARPEYDPLPIPVAGFRLSPEVAASFGYDDNVFARPITASDAVFHIAPSVLAESDWTRHFVSLFGRVDSASFLDHSSESVVDYAFGANGRYDLASDAGLSAGASFEQDTEPRTSPSSPATAAEPVRFTVAKAYLGGVKQFNRVRLSLEGDVRDYTYDDPDAIGGGVILQRDQSHTTTQIVGTAEYAYSPITSFFIQATGDKRSFRDELDINPSRDSSGYTVTIGADVEVRRLLRGRFGVGYLEQDYDDARFDKVSGLAVQGSLQYFPTPFLTFTAGGSRSVQDASVVGSSGYLASVARVRADYELLRQLTVSLVGAYENNDFRGIDRNDDRYSASLIGQYFISHHLRLFLSYSYLRQSSTGSLRGLDFRTDQVSGGLSYHF